MKVGELQNFKLNSFLDVINELMRADETERALWVCDNLPAYYRDNKPKEIIEIKNEILKRVATPRLYANGEFDCQVDFENKIGMERSLRGHLIVNDVKKLNNLNIRPHVVDYGPGEYWLPIVLKKMKCEFTYEPIYLNKKAFQTVSPYIEELLSKDYKYRPVIYSACEIIEHLWHQQELKTEMLSSCGFADIVHISTPKYTFDGTDLDWKKYKPEVGHLRAYTPAEFYKTVETMFPEYDAKFVDSQILHARLVNKDTRFFIEKSIDLGELLVNV